MTKNFKNASQNEIDEFLQSVSNNSEIFPWLTSCRYFSKIKELESDWEGIRVTDDRLSYLLIVSFDRTSNLVFNISLYAKSTFAAGKGILALKTLVSRYKPEFIDSMVAKSNKKSFDITKKILGDPWGLKPLAWWNMLSGQFEDAYFFRKVLCNEK